MKEQRSITYELVKQLAILAEEKNGWKKEVNLVHWNNSPAGPKIDIRSWSEDHEAMSKGVTLSYEEANVLRNTLNAAFSDRTLRTPDQEEGCFEYKTITMEIEDNQVFIAEPGSSGATYDADGIDSIVEAFRCYLLQQTSLQKKPL